MIIKKMASVFSNVTKLTLGFVTRKKLKVGPSFPSSFVLNDNLKFDARQFDLYVMPRHPKIASEKATGFTIDHKSTVVEFNFVKKINLQLQSSLQAKQMDQNWSQRVTIPLHFWQVARVAMFKLGSKQKIHFNEVNKEGDTTTTVQIGLNDVSESSQIEFYRKQKVQIAGQQPSYSKFSGFTKNFQFQIIQQILKESLYDLSGLRFMLDMKRSQIIQQLSKDLQDSNRKNFQASDYYQKN